MANTTNFGWETPDDTDLVKDGAAAIRTLGSAIDTSLVDLKGGTTGQLLAKASNTDMDFTWTGAGIPATIFDAKGDLIAASAADTAARLAVGTNGQYLSANSSTATGLEWVTLSAGGMTLIASGTLSTTAVNITSIPATYKHLQLWVKNSRTSTDNFDLRMRFQNDSNARYFNTSSTQTIQTFGATSVYIATGQDNVDAQGFCVVDIFDYTNTTTWKGGKAWSMANDQTTPTSASVLNQNIGYNQTGAINQINLISTGTAFAAGTYALYGVN